MWRNYSGRSKKLSISPVITVLQDFLSNVEELELGRTLEAPDYIYRDVGSVRVIEALCKVSYVLLYTIVTSDHSCLKHLKVFDIPMIAERILEAVAELFCESNTSQMPSFPPKSNLLPIQLEMAKAERSMPLTLMHVSPKPEPYQLESISILPRGQYSHQINASSARHIASVSGSIIAYQMHSLRCVTIQNIGFCTSNDGQSQVIGRPEQNVNVPAYAALLSLLCQFLKQPQFEALSIDQTLFSAAHELIVTFLTTPTSHKQMLSIEGRKEEESVSKMEEGDLPNESRKRKDAFESSDIPPSKKQSPLTLEQI